MAGDRVSALAQLIVHLARRSMYNNVGRVTVQELLEEGFTRDEITLAIGELGRRYRVVVVGDCIKVYF
uniref:Uncharacterized protein n=1 Tax=Thermofilum pendens TaxID=2269 RepID=A0A7J3X710_THEPE